MQRLTACILLALVLAVAAQAAEADTTVLLAGLKARAPRERIDAAIALRAAPVPGTEAIPALVAALGDDYFEVRWTAMTLLQRLGAPAVPALTRALTDQSFHRRWCAARALAGIGAAAAPAAPALATAFRTDGIDVRLEAGRALLAIGRTQEATEAAVRALGHPNSEVRTLAVALLQSAGKEAVPAIARLLDDPDLAVRRSAALALGGIGAEAAPAVPGLMRLMRDELTLTQRALADVGDGGIRDSRIRHGMADQASLAVLGQLGAAAVPPMIPLLQSGDEIAIRWACRVLGRVGGAAKPAIPALLAAFHTATLPTIRGAITETLGGIGVSAPEVLAVLTEGLRGDADPVRRTSAIALGRLKAVAALAGVVQTGPREGCLLALQTLAGLGPAAADALPALKQAATDADPAVKAAAEAALQAVAPQQ